MNKTTKREFIELCFSVPLFICYDHSPLSPLFVWKEHPILLTLPHRNTNPIRSRLERHSMDSSIRETHNPSGPRSVHLRRLLQQNKSKARSLQGFLGSVSCSVQLPLHPVHQQSRHHSFLRPLSLQGHHRFQEKPLWSSIHLFHVLHCLHHLQSQVLWVPQL